MARADLAISTAFRARVAADIDPSNRPAPGLGCCLMVCCLLVSTAGCTPVYRGQRVYQGKVVAEDGTALAGVRVTACFLGRSPTDHPRDCAAGQWKSAVVTGAHGEFEIAEPKEFVPGQSGPSGPFDTNLRFERLGYEARELYWWRDHGVLKSHPLIVELKRAPPSEGSRDGNDPPPP